MKGNAQAGFTLIELLVGLVLLGLLTAGLTPSLRLGGQAWDVVDRSASAGAEMQVVQDFLRRTIAEAYPVSFVDQDGRRRLAFAGDGDNVALVAPMPTYLGLGGLQIIRIAVEEAEGRRDLIATWTPLLPDSQVLELSETAQKTVLARDVRTLDLKYYGREAASDPPGWFDGWRDHAGLPKLIRLRLTFTDDDRNWPDLLARPMIDLGAMVRR